MGENVRYRIRFQCHDQQSYGSHMHHNLVNQGWCWSLMHPMNNNRCHHIDISVGNNMNPLKQCHGDIMNEWYDEGYISAKLPTLSCDVDATWIEKVRMGTTI
jgi:hypothetical protein